MAALPRLLFSAALALLPAPALADVTARYALGKDVLTIEADDGGDWRVDLPGQFTLIRRGGIDYVVATVGEEAMVFKLDDLAEALRGKLLGASRTPGSDALTRERFALTAGPEVAVAGYKGVLWSFGPEKPSPSGRRLEVVTSKDKALAPVGAVFLALQGRIEALGAGQFAPDSNFLSLFRTIVASGTPIRAAKLMELASVDATAIDPKRFELPGPVRDAALLTQKYPTHAQTVVVPIASEPQP
jgi:hypothetical protein